MRCPVPDSGSSEQLTLAHGEGGGLMRRLIRERIVPALGNDWMLPLGDAAILPRPSGSWAFTTDSFVVSPLFFPGGDIGSLAIFGTVNDLVVAGARPRWISLGLIAEEGLAMSTLERVLTSIAAAAEQVGVRVVTGDTKVVPRGAADGLFVNTSGAGELVPPEIPGPSALQVGDELLVSGPIGRHGIAVLACREGLALDPAPRSDCGPLCDVVQALRAAKVPIRAIRDATRGGVAAVLHEWAEASNATLTLDESSLPVSNDVRGACELLGLDPVHVANEGTLVLAVPQGQADAALAAWRDMPQTAHGARIGEVRSRSAVAVSVRRALGQEVALDEPLGAPLPRIC